jgi:hypothetical protein
MRIALVILLLTAIGVGLVEIRRQEVVFQHEIQQLTKDQVRLGQESWALDVRLGSLTAVEALRSRAQEMGLVLEGPTPSESSPQSPAAEPARD